MSFKILLLFIAVQVLLKDTYGQRSKKFFRKDYNYLEATQSFYKIHTVERNWLDAKRTCTKECATLFYPEDKNEADVVLAHLNKTHHHIYNYIFIGISDLVATTVFETIDGRSILDVYNNWDDGQPDNSYGGTDGCVILRRSGIMSDVSCQKTSAFICKRTLASLDWNTQCDTPYLEYTYNDKIGRCYKLHTAPMNWTEAYAVCATELSYLAVIDTQDEANILTEMVKNGAVNKFGNYVRGAVLLGFHNRLDEGWTTVKGSSLEESGYQNWGNHQPVGGEMEKCGSMFYNGSLNDIKCNHKAFFICEHEVNFLENFLNDRFSGN